MKKSFHPCDVHCLKGSHGTLLREYTRSLVDIPGVVPHRRDGVNIAHKQAMRIAVRRHLQKYAFLQTWTELHKRLTKLNMPHSTWQDWLQDNACVHQRYHPTHEYWPRTPIPVDVAHLRAKYAGSTNSKQDADLVMAVVNKLSHSSQTSLLQPTGVETATKLYTHFIQIFHPHPPPQETDPIPSTQLELDETETRPFDPEYTHSDEWICHPTMSSSDEEDAFLFNLGTNDEFVLLDSLHEQTEYDPYTLIDRDNFTECTPGV